MFKWIHRNCEEELREKTIDIADRFERIGRQSSENKITVLNETIENLTQSLICRTSQYEIVGKALVEKSKLVEELKEEIEKLRKKSNK
jgi:archaellum component FlaC